MPRHFVVLLAALLVACESHSPAQPLDCFGTSCGGGSTCCLSGGVASCVTDIAACRATVCVAATDAGPQPVDASAPDAACFTTVPAFQCLKDTDCPANDAGWQQVCCATDDWVDSTSTSTYCALACSLLGPDMCTNAADCRTGRCQTIVDQGITLPFKLCK
jgi:hypothetical protein